MHPHCVEEWQQGELRRAEHEGHADATHAQLPLTQLSPVAHAWVDPQPPQLFRSVCSFTHPPLHGV